MEQLRWTGGTACGLGLPLSTQTSQSRAQDLDDKREALRATDRLPYLTRSPHLINVQIVLGAS